jgi:small subunit ribosomal protein S6
MRHYEQVFILKPALTKDESVSVIEAIKESIVKNGGEILLFQDIGIRKLAYKVQKNPRGYYGILYFKIAPSAISELERLLKINEDVIKYLTVKYETKKEVKAFNELMAKATKKKEGYTPKTDSAKTEEAPAPEQKPEA